MNKLKRPYCRIDNKPYQLEYIDNVLRFPKTTVNITENLNYIWLSYMNNNRKLEDLFIIYTTTGSSYELVHETFSHEGQNNHLVTQGKGKTKSFRLYK